MKLVEEQKCSYLTQWVASFLNSFWCALSHQKQFSGSLIESRIADGRDPLSGTAHKYQDEVLSLEQILVLEEVKIWE